VHPLAVQFGTVVRRHREAAGLSQEALAADAGLHRTYISMLERGVRMPSILVVRQVAVALGTSLGALLTDVDREPEPERPRRAGRRPTGPKPPGSQDTADRQGSRKR
jgi:transcriptional regulator with XRE-family HTH domain